LLIALAITVFPPVSRWTSAGARLAELRQSLKLAAASEMAAALSG
jgi:hypothetical protein